MSARPETAGGHASVQTGQYPWAHPEQWPTSTLMCHAQVPQYWRMLGRRGWSHCHCHHHANGRHMYTGVQVGNLHWMEGC